MTDTARQTLKMLRPSAAQFYQVEESGLFDATWYGKTYPDVALSGVDPLRHFLQIGTLLGRDPSPHFSTQFYLDSNPDVRAADVNPFLHYLDHGRAEARSVLPSAQITQRMAAGLGVPMGPTGKAEAQLESPLLVLFPDGALQDTLPEAVLTLALAILDGAAKAPQISVIMPTWNRRHVIGAAIDSVLAQAFAPAELLVVDDGSTDGTIAFLQVTYADQLASGLIKIIPGTHAGVCPARNLGLTHATGDLIAYLDSDNTWRPAYLAVMAATFVANPAVLTAYSGLAHNDQDRAANAPAKLNGRPFDRPSLIKQNYIDLNVFMHDRLVYEQLGGFDEGLRRLVDWDLIIRYTGLYEPAYLPFVGVDYFLDKAGLGNITRTVPMEDAREAIMRKVSKDRVRHDIDALRLAYVVWDWPAMSQTFLLNELRWLVEYGFDVKVYYHTGVDREANLDFEIRTQKVATADELADALVHDRRNQCHNHFVFPGTTKLVWPACRKTGIPFTVFAHAIDIFLEANIARNQVAEIAADPLCQKIFVYGDHHRQFLAKKGVPPEKIAYNFQAVNLRTFEQTPDLALRSANRPAKGILVARFVEKKGIPTLIRALAQLPADRVEVDIHGYGPLEDECRALAKDLGVTNVNFCGALETPEAYAAAIAAADFMLVPSIVAQNGDTEGFPTVILEAMAAGRPVVTTTVSSLPDFLTDGHNAILSIPADPASLADGITRLLDYTPEQTAALVREAKSFVAARVGVQRTMQNYWDIWTSAALNLFMVTFNTPKYDNTEATFEIIARILRHTTTPFTLTIVDNASEAGFRYKLRAVAAAHPQIRLILLDANRFCGPASNLALSFGYEKYGIYICSKEGFVARHGWERALVDHMRRNTGTAIAGYKMHMPRFTLGAELATHLKFANFRNPAFARNNPERPFQHVQGGIFILDREVWAETGGFSDVLVQDMMDVEYSYFLESEGYRLGTVPGVAALTVKTLPKLDAILDETTLIAHPLTPAQVQAKLDPLQDPAATRCNLCDSSARLDQDGTCPACGSTGFGRRVYQILAHDWRGHRKEWAVIDVADPVLSKRLSERLFTVASKGQQADALAKLIVTDQVPDRLSDVTDRLALDGIALLPATTALLTAALPADVTRTALHQASRVLRTQGLSLMQLHRAGPR